MYYAPGNYYVGNRVGIFDTVARQFSEVDTMDFPVAYPLSQQEIDQDGWDRYNPRGSITVVSDYSGDSKCNNNAAAIGTKVSLSLLSARRCSM